MNKLDPPTSFGIFKPVGHTLMAFRDDTQLREAVESLESIGFTSESWVSYAPSEMIEQINAQLSAYNPLANFGYELDLVHAHKLLAEQGSSFLVVEAPTEDLAAKVATLVGHIKPVAAQHYGRLLIEDLTERSPGRMAKSTLPGAL